jgi:hypothetical protein
VRLSSLVTLATNWPLAAAPDDDDDDECGAVSGMRIGRENRSARRKPAPLPLCPPQIQHNLTWVRTLVAAVVSRRLTSSAMARPCLYSYVNEVSYESVLRFLELEVLSAIFMKSSVFWDITAYSPVTVN